MLSKTTARPRCASSPGLGGARLEQRAIRADVAFEDPDAGRLADRISDVAYDIGIVDLRLPNRVAQTPALHRRCIQMQVIGQLRHQRGQPPGIVKLLHEEPAGRHEIGDVGNAPAEAIEVFQCQFDAGAPRQCEEMDDRIGGPADRRVDSNGILEGFPREKVREPQVFVHETHDAAAREVRDPLAVRGDARRGGIHGQGDAEGFDYRRE